LGLYDAIQLPGPDGGADAIADQFFSGILGALPERPAGVWMTGDAAFADAAYRSYGPGKNRLS
jgi:hypothetical protein